jgi:hypothetical protein
MNKELKDKIVFEIMDWENKRKNIEEDIVTLMKIYFSGYKLDNRTNYHNTKTEKSFYQKNSSYKVSVCFDRSAIEKNVTVRIKAGYDYVSNIKIFDINESEDIKKEVMCLITKVKILDSFRLNTCDSK